MHNVMLLVKKYNDVPAAWTQLDLFAPGELIDAIFAIPIASKVPDDFDTYLSCVRCDEDGCEGFLTGWGPVGAEADQLMFVHASSLLALKDHPEVREHAINRAAWSYLAALPPETLVIPYYTH